MFERFLAVPLHFTIEFLGFLVVAGGALLVPSRPSLIPGTRINRWIAALGFAALAGAQVLHGGAFAFAESDADQTLTVLKTLGLALILIGVVGAAGRASAGLIFAQPAQDTNKALDLAPAVAAGAVALMAFAVSVRSSK